LTLERSGAFSHQVGHTDPPFETQASAVSRSLPHTHTHTSSLPPSLPLSLSLSHSQGGGYLGQEIMAQAQIRKARELRQNRVDVRQVVVVQV